MEICRDLPAGRQGFRIKIIRIFSGMTKKNVILNLIQDLKTNGRFRIKSGMTN